MKLKINPVLQELVPQLTKEEDDAIDKSIETDGLWPSHPLTAAPDGDVCDGMNRYAKCLKHKKETHYIINPDLKTLEDKKKFVIKNLIARRHLNNWQKGLLALKLMELLDPQDCGYKAAEAVKQVPGMKLRTFEKIIRIQKDITPALKKSLDSGKKSVDTAYKQVTRVDRNLPKAELPKGEYDVIYCDVPIAFDNDGVRGAAKGHYDTMTAEELGAMKIPTAKNTIIFYWVQPSQLTSAAEVLTAWGFDFDKKPHFAWPKEQWGNGSWLRSQHELLLMAIKGKMPTPAKLYSSVIDAPEGEHSEKPEIVYEMIEGMYSKRNYLELFARGKKKRDGWTFFGDEVDTNG